MNSVNVPIFSQNQTHIRYSYLNFEDNHNLIKYIILITIKKHNVREGGDKSLCHPLFKSIPLPITVNMIQFMCNHFI